MAEDRVLVCVTGQKNCEKLIEEGHRLAREFGSELSVLHVAEPGIHFLGNPVEGEALEYLYKISSEYGADMTVLRSDDVAGAILSHVRKHGVSRLVMGRSRASSPWDLSSELRLRNPKLDVHIVITYA